MKTRTSVTSHPVYTRMAYCMFAALLYAMITAGTCRPVATVNLAAADLDVKITIIDIDRTPSDGKLPVFIQFFSNGSYVKLAGGTSVTCNGVALPDNGIGYAERVPLVSPGGTYTFRYLRSGITTTIPVTVPARPVITSPANGAAVARSASLNINYVAGTSTGVRGGAGDNATGISPGSQPDNGTYTGINVSAFNAGPGSISITRDFQFNPASGFKSTEVKYSSGNSHNVTWN